MNEKGEALARVWKNFKIPIILGSVSFFLIVFSITLLLKSYQPIKPIEFSSSEATVAGALNELVVDISGAVVRPGVYRLSGGARVEDAIAAAGGLSGEADVERIAASVNRAAKLIDGAKIWIPKLGSDLQKGQTPYNGLTPMSGLTPVNSASQSQLEALPGIGPVTAKKIIDNRPYMALEELVSKKVIGQSLFNKIKEQLTL